MLSERPGVFPRDGMLLPTARTMEGRPKPFALAKGTNPLFNQLADFFKKNLLTKQKTNMSKNVCPTSSDWVVGDTGLLQPPN